MLEKSLSLVALPGMAAEKEKNILPVDNDSVSVAKSGDHKTRVEKK